MGKLFTGYMVVWKNGDPLWLDRYGVLWRSTGRLATAIFKDRAAAERAITKTLHHADRYNISWKRDDYRIQGVRNV